LKFTEVVLVVDKVGIFDFFETEFDEIFLAMCAGFAVTEPYVLIKRKILFVIHDTNYIYSAIIFFVIKFLFERGIFIILSKIF
tara:strand:+ start:1788 stop:2036 length:249 start_codon:yes stop_codon:yes gene_type:complete